MNETWTRGENSLIGVLEKNWGNLTLPHLKFMGVKSHLTQL